MTFPSIRPLMVISLASETVSALLRFSIISYLSFEYTCSPWLSTIQMASGIVLIMGSSSSIFCSRLVFAMMILLIANYCSKLLLIFYTESGECQCIICYEKVTTYRQIVLRMSNKSIGNTHKLNDEHACNHGKNR